MEQNPFLPRGRAVRGVYAPSFARRAYLASVLVLSIVGCANPSRSGEAGVSTDDPGSPARLSLGATRGQALDGGVSSFLLESTPDLILHADLRDGSYEGKTLLIQGRDPAGKIVWQYPHLQKGTSFDAELPVFGSPAARNHITGPYTFEVTGPDRTVVAAGSARFGSTRENAGRGGASHAPSSAAGKE